MYLLVLLLITCGILPLYGFYTLEGMVLIILAYICLLGVTFFNVSSALVNRKVEWGLFAAVAILTTISWGGVAQEQTVFLVGKLVLGIYWVVVALLIYWKKNISLVLPSVCFCLLAVAVIVSSPHPNVDTVVILKEAPLAFLQGTNPYSMVFTKMYEGIEPNYYNYLPASFIYLSPFVWIFGDHRYAVVLTQLLGGIGLYKLFGALLSRKVLILLLSLFFFLPGTGYIIEYGYLDVIIVTFFLFYEYYLRAGKKGWAAGFLGLFFAIKQPPLLSLPMMLRVKSRVGLKHLFLALCLPGVLVLMYLLIDHQAFLYDTVFGLTPQNITSPIPYSLTAKTLLVKQFGFDDSLAVSINLVLFVFMYGLLFVRNLAYIDKLLLFFLSFNIFTYHAFFNSYYLVMLLLIYRIGLEWAEHGQRATKVTNE